MIHHISISAEQPQHVAQVLAELLDGIAIPFIAHQGSFVALALDALGTMVEVLPIGTVLEPGSRPAEASLFSQVEAIRSYVPTHAAISVACSQEQIEQIARREGWRCERFVRGDNYFELLELWIENRQLIELLPPAETERYLEFFRPENLRQLMPAQ